MNNEIIIAIVIAVAIVAAVITAAKFPKIRHAFLVQEGYAGLLYHKGRFVNVLGAGRHVRWPFDRAPRHSPPTARSVSPLPVPGRRREG